MLYSDIVKQNPTYRSRNISDEHSCRKFSFKDVILRRHVKLVVQLHTYPKSSVKHDWNRKG